MFITLNKLLTHIKKKKKKESFKTSWVKTKTIHIYLRPYNRKTLKNAGMLLKDKFFVCNVCVPRIVLGEVTRNSLFYIRAKFCDTI